MRSFHVLIWVVGSVAAFVAGVMFIVLVNSWAIGGIGR